MKILLAILILSALAIAGARGVLEIYLWVMARARDQGPGNRDQGIGTREQGIGSTTEAQRTQR